MTTRSGSITPPTDTAELWENANKALKELFATKASIDAHRHRAIWELGMNLHQNESEAMKSIKEARAICSWVTLDAKAQCFMTAKEAKTTWACNIQESEAAWSMAIRDAKTQRASHAELLQREHDKVMQNLETQAIQEEGRSQADFLSACQAALYTSPVELKGMLVASYHVLLGQTPTSHPFALSQRTSPVEEQSAPTAPPCQCPSSPLGPKDNILPQILWRACLWAEPHPRQHQKGPPVPSSRRSHLGTRHSSQAVQRHSARTLTW